MSDVSSLHSVFLLFSVNMKKREQRSFPCFLIYFFVRTSLFFWEGDLSRLSFYSLVYVVDPFYEQEDSKNLFHKLFVVGSALLLLSISFNNSKWTESVRLSPSSPFSLCYFLTANKERVDCWVTKENLLFRRSQLLSNRMIWEVRLNSSKLQDQRILTDMFFFLIKVCVLIL